MKIVITPPEGIQYKVLIPGSMYRKFGEAKDRIWIVSPSEGDFYVEDGIISGQYKSKQVEDETFVEPLGHLRFTDL